MKKMLGALLFVALAAGLGCHSGSSGGPGTEDPSKEHYVGNPDESFNIVMVETQIRQGETKTVTIPIKRTVNFEEDVTLSFEDMPRGITVDDPHPKIKHGEPGARVQLTAADDASLGDFTLKVTGHPTRGGDAVNDFKLKVLPRSPRN
ncbi:MAG TPA: hypothetical protein VFF73_12180 [Planctomycetota bacterium]|nr:hypothetical protein [Planctomycetota bacterium]